LKIRLEVRFGLLWWGIYEKYTTWDFNGESVDLFNGDNFSESDKNEGGYNSDKVNMAEVVCSV